MRVLLHSHHLELVGKFSEKLTTNSRKIFGEFSVNFGQIVSDPYLNKYQTLPASSALKILKDVILT